MSVIDKPGVYEGVPHVDYVSDCVKGGSLSSHGARKLLPPHAPATFKWESENRRPDKAAYDLGSGAHWYVLGDGPAIVPIDADDWRGKAAREARDAARAEGAVPLLRKDYDRCRAMADALQSHPVAAELFRPGTGVPEATLVWQDDETGVWRRARLDWLPTAQRPRFIVPDYKTSRSAYPDRFGRIAAAFGYHQQAAWYIDGVKALGLDDDPAFLFVVQETEPPYLTSVIELDSIALKIGHDLNRQALETYADCKRTGVWPGYSPGIELVSLPAWYEGEHTDTEMVI